MDINDQIADNTGLIYKQLATFNLIYDQDAESFAYEALYNAILTYDSKAGVAFSTYAVCCINNALRKHLRSLNKKRQLDIVSYDAPISPNDDAMCLADILEHPESVEQLLLSEESCRRLLRAFKYEYVLLSPKHQEVIRTFYTIGNNATQQHIAKTVGLSQGAVSKIVSAFRHRIKLRMEEYE